MGQLGVLSQPEVDEMRTELLVGIDARVLQYLELAAGEVHAHAYPFESRLGLLSEVIGFTRGHVTMDDLRTLSDELKLKLAAYVYHIIDRKLDWGKVWGATFNEREMKERFIACLQGMARYLSPDAVILDVGSGRHPLGRELLGRESGRRLVAIDIAAPETREEGQVLVVRLDIDLITDPRNQSVVEAMAAVQRFTGRDPLQFDAIVLGDILNYVNAPEVLAWLLPMIRREGFLAVCNHEGLYTSPTYLRGGAVNLCELWPNGKIEGFSRIVAEFEEDPRAEDQIDAIAIFRKR